MKFSENGRHQEVTGSKFYALSNEDNALIDAFNDCPALTGLFFKFIEDQVVEAVGKMTPGDTCEIASLIDCFLWDYFGKDGKKAVFRCIDCLILDGLPLVRAYRNNDGYPGFMRVFQPEDDCRVQNRMR